MGPVSISDSSIHPDVTDQLVRIWTDVLQVTVRTQKTFLDLGGDSLAAMSCIVRMRDAFGVEFAIDDFLTEDATIAGFSARIAAKR